MEYDAIEKFSSLLVGWPHPKSYSRCLGVRVETSNKCCPSRVCMGTNIIYCSDQWHRQWDQLHLQQVYKLYPAECCSHHTGEQGCLPEGPWQASEVELYEDLMKINKTKCKVLDVSGDHLQYQHRIRIAWIERSPEEMDLGILVDEKLNVTQQCVLATENTSCTLGCMKRVMASMWMVVILPLYPALVSPSWDTAPSSGAPSAGNTWT